MSKFKLKRDITGTSFPHADQLDVGELVINSVTGRLYSKLVDGSIVEFLGQKVCFNLQPEINFYHNSIIVPETLNNFCCNGDALSVEVKKLMLSPANYSYEFIELTDNTNPNNIVLSDPQYSNYQESSTTYRKAIIPISLNINATNNISIFKFTILLDSIKVSEKLIIINCFEQSCS